ncbi:hypothetical protein pCXcHC2016_10 [Xenohaliotis phage pCXc-HC2016]|nr:hypothetical protein pCXcHC2016_10 [Xenohaliotis phage pCXc-HC2016]AQW89117.1 hypothetical protein pCXcHR2015_10 [Xenohaliotis phage pCXc-HR2015]
MSVTSQLSGIAGAVSFIEDPTAPNQIPLSTRDVSGNFYWKASNASYPELTGADVGKAYGIVAIDASGAVTFGGVDAFILDDAVASIINQAGVITPPDLSVTGTSTITVGPFKAVFYEQAAGAVAPIRTIVDNASQQTITINAVGASTEDVTYLKFLSDGSFSQETQDPSADQIVVDNYIVRVLHPGGAKIISLVPLSTIYGSPQQNLQNYAKRLGIDANDVSFTINGTALAQSGPNARLYGYNINYSAGSDNTSVRELPVGNIAAEYYSFDSAERGFLFDLRRTYKLDDPSNGTSSTLANFGIMTIYILSNGDYYLLAPQRNYTTIDSAKTDLLFYLTSIVVPEFLSKYASLLGAVVVPATVIDANLNTVFTANISNISLASSGGGVQTLTIDPSTGTNDDVVGTNGTNFVLRKENAFNVTGGNEGDVLVKRGSSFAVEPIANQGVPRFNLGVNRGGFIKFNRDTGAVISSNGDISSDFTTTVTVNLVDNAYWITFNETGTKKPLWMSIFVQNTAGEMMPVVPNLSSNVDCLIPAFITPTETLFLLNYLLV